MLLFTSSVPAAPGAITDRIKPKKPDAPEVLYSKEEHLRAFEALAVLCALDMQAH